MPLGRPSSVPRPRYRSSSRGARRGVAGGYHAPPKRSQAEIEAAWAHPNGFPLSEVEVGCEYDGTVTNARRAIGIFVDFGAVKDGLLRVPHRIRNEFYVGMKVKNMQVVKVDLVSHHVVLKTDYDFSLDLEDSVKGRGSARPRSRPPRDFDHPGGMPLEEVEEGSIHEDGVVTASGPHGIFIDFGAVKDGRLLLPRPLQSLQRHFKVGDVISSCQVESVEIENGKITLGLENPEDVVAKLDAGRTPIEEISVGDYMSGYVNTANASGIFVNIQTQKDGRLAVSRKQGLQMQVGQQLFNMKVISVDMETQFIKLSLPEDDDDLDKEQPPPLVRRATSKTKDKAEVRVIPKARLRPESASAPRAKARAEPSPPAKLRSRPKAASAGKQGPAVSGASRVLGRKQLPPEPEEDDRDTVDSMGLIPLENLMVEQEINGIVKGKSPQGVIVDIGATKYGILVTTTKEDDFQEGDQVQGMMIDEVDLKGRQIWLSMEDPELSIADSDADDRPPKKPQEPVVVSKSKAKARPKTTEGDARPRQRVGPR